jgi:uncharacterized protein YlxW (UPF0749 family)
MMNARDAREQLSPDCSLDAELTSNRILILILSRLQELKIKAGAEKLREVATDRKSLSDVATIVKKANTKLNELQAELQQLESQIILTQGQPQSPQQNHSNGQGS